LPSLQKYPTPWLKGLGVRGRRRQQRPVRTGRARAARHQKGKGRRGGGRLAARGLFAQRKCPTSPTPVRKCPMSRMLCSRICSTLAMCRRQQQPSPRDSSRSSPFTSGQLSRPLLRTFASAPLLQLQKCGKMIVAVSDDELPRLDKLYERDVANGVKHLVYMSSLPRSSHTAPHWPWFGNLSNYYIFFLSTLSVAEEE